ncbi:SDR family oxidoreductase [Fulvivirga sp. M361]|uniref:SDR family oxidoreductase n=1 Tax=Fulvivirga sp. M361 TaxID=2594266 RepID=UPI001179B5E7|nr:SDR family oxidoreductase [Fulvivirga sp. M361]TRX58367.1 SDR family oxidoreductase [Fulvivirga sp. M361]
MSELNKKNISVLGCGWLGMPLAKQLIKTGAYTISGSTTTSEKLKKIKDAGIQPFIIDLKKNIPPGFLTCDILVITVPPSSGNYENRIKRLIGQIKTSNVRKVVFISTTSVYPNSGKIAVESDAAYITSSHSGVTMLAIEDMFRHEGSFGTTILRFAGLYGPERHPGRFLAAKRELSGAENPVNLIHQEDCVNIILRIIEDECWGETFNACADEHPIRKVFYTKAAHHLGVGAPTFTDKASGYKVISSEKLKRALGYTFLHADPMEDLQR